MPEGHVWVAPRTPYYRPSDVITELEGVERVREVIDFSAFNAHYPVLALIKAQTQEELREVAGVISNLRSVSHIEYFIVKYADES